MINFDGHDVFIQPIKLVSNTGDRLLAAAHVTDTSTLHPGKIVELLCSVTSNGLAAKNVKGNYILKTQDNQLITHGKLTTDLAGNALFSFTYPVIDALKSLTLSALFNNGKTIAEIKLNLPPERRRITINTTAEGGTLIDGIKGRVLIETTNENGQPVTAHVCLYNGRTRITDVITNSKGRGVIQFIPSQEKTYNLISVSGDNKQTTPLALKTLPKGCTLNISNIKGKSVAIIHNKGMPANASLILRNMQEVIWHQSIVVKSWDSLSIALPTVDSVKQVLSLAMFNDQGQLLNERLFLSRMHEDYQVKFNISKVIYGLKEKVRVTIKVTDNNGKPVESNCSIATINQKALDESIYRIISNGEYSQINAPNQSHRLFDGRETDLMTR